MRIVITKVSFLLTIDNQKKEIIEISEVSSSSNIIVKINSILFNPEFGHENFTFNKNNYTDYYVESVEL